MSIIGHIGEFILDVLNGFLNLILYPIDVALSGLIPNYSDMNTAIDSIFTYLHNSILWALEWFHFPPLVINLLVAYLLFKLAFIPLAIGMKVALSLYSKLH